MKKLLLLAGIALFNTSYAQTFAETLTLDKFEYALGQFGANIPDGSTVALGQGDWITWASAGATNGTHTSFQIVEGGGVQGRSLSILGSNTNTGTRAIVDEGMLEKWGNRNDGSVFQAEAKIFLSDSDASDNHSRLYLYDATGTMLLASINISTKTGEIRLGAYSDAAVVTGSGASDIGNWIWTFTEKTYVPKNKWVTVAIAWDSSSGDTFVLWDFNDGEGTDGAYIPGAAAGMDAGELYVGTAGRLLNAENNTAGSTVLYDDVMAFATDEVADLGVLETLSVKDVKTKSSFSVYPNPTADVLNLKGAAKVESVQVYDMSGRAANVSLTNNQVDVRNLAKGTYVVKIQTAEGTTTQKFIKK